MTNDELQDLIDKISIDSFNLPFNHQASFNARLRTTGGRYMLETHNIEINPRIEREYSSEILIGS